MCVDGDVEKLVGGLALNAAITALTGLAWGSGKVPLMDVALLGFICLAVITSRLNGWMPVTSKAALIVSTVKAET